jgi:hypothetical protein
MIIECPMNDFKTLLDNHASFHASGRLQVVWIYIKVVSFFCTSILSPASSIKLNAFSAKMNVKMKKETKREVFENRKLSYI